MEMADRIKERRKAMGFTQTELGEKLGLQASAIAKYENGRVENIKRSTIADMAKVLECSPAYLMGWSDFVEDVDGNEKYNVYVNVPASSANEAIFVAMKGMLEITGYKEMAKSLTQDEALELYKSLNFDEVVTLDQLKLRQFNKIKKYYDMLNDMGKHEATKRVQELTEVPRYLMENTSYVNAAHAVDGASEEDKQFDEDIMNDENF